MSNKAIAKTLNGLLSNLGGYIHAEKHIKFITWKMSGNSIVFKYEEVKTGVRLDHDVSFEYLDRFINALTPVTESLPVPKTVTDLRNILMDNIVRLQTGQIELDTAKEVANHCQTIVNLTKLELHYYKEFKGRTPKDIPFIYSEMQNTNASPLTSNQ